MRITFYLMSVLMLINNFSSANAEKAILVLDASGSMWGKIDGQSKIEIARGVVSDILRDWPSNIELGLIAYGHREKANCADIQTLVPVGRIKTQVIQSAIDNVDPKGKTPLSDAIRLAASELRSEEEKATVILVSDGLETCEADPCAAASELEKAGVDFALHVVGFDTKEEENEQLRCLADNTGGVFLGARNAGELKEAMTKTVQLVKEVRAEPASSTIFLDSFDGEDLDKRWTVRNKDQEAFIVENGELFVFTSQTGGVLTAPNAFTLSDIELKGDWDISVKFRPGFETGADKLQIGLLDKDDTPLWASIWRDSLSGETCQSLSIAISRGGKQEANHSIYVLGVGCGRGNLKDAEFERIYTAMAKQGVKFTLSKRGRNYQAKLSSPALPKDFETPQLTMLRAKGQPAFAVGRDRDRQGQTSAHIEEFRIESPK